jgi:hypothetical protein
MDFYTQKILSQLPNYLKLKKYKYTLRADMLRMLCPYCEQMTAQRVAQTGLIKCLNPDCKSKGQKFTLLSIVKYVEPDKKDWAGEKILRYIRKLFKVQVMSEEDVAAVIKQLAGYEEKKWSLTFIKHNDKECFESEWQNKTHFSKIEWIEWIKIGLNVAVRTGKVSNVTVIDLDDITLVPEEMKNLLGTTLVQQTDKHKFHYFYEYDADIPKTRIDKYKIDIENENGLITISPSIVEGRERKFNDHPIIKMPTKLKEYLIKNIGIKNLKSDSIRLKEEITQETYRKPLLKEGDGRNDLLFHYGAILRKRMPNADTEYAIRTLNNIICEIPVNQKELRPLLASINKYSVFDQKELANRVLQHIKNMKEVTHRDIERSISGDSKLSAEEKTNVDKAIAFLIKENYIKKNRMLYSTKEGIEWETDLTDWAKPLDFKMPYFYDVGYFIPRDMFIIGAKTGIGKTHLALNIIKQLVEQNVAPEKLRYIGLEGNSRYKKIALQLGLKEGDFYSNKHYINPLKVELEDDVITILDWLNPEEFKDMHLIFQHFQEQLDTHGGNLIVFVQLKEDEAGSWFAPNLIKQFAALAVRYFYETEDGLQGYFTVDKVRAAMKALRFLKIPCVYDWDTKLLKRVDEIKDVKPTVIEEKSLAGGEEEKSESN